MQALVIRLYKIEKMGAPSLYTLSVNTSQLKRTFPGEHKALKATPRGNIGSMRTTMIGGIISLALVSLIVLLSRSD